MRYFLISLSLLLTACGSYPKQHGFEKIPGTEARILNPYFSNLEKDYVYKARITLGDRSFGGIFVAKKIAADQYRVVFTTEMGNKLFDFSYLGDTFQVNYILDEMNRKMLINLLRTDFHLLLLESPTLVQQYGKSGNTTLFKARVDGNTYFYRLLDENLDKIWDTRWGKEKTEYQFRGPAGPFADEIHIRHKGLNLNIHLKSI